MTSASIRDERMAAFYDRHADRLRRVVAGKVSAPAQTIEDACQNAWAILVCRDDIPLDDRGSSWLATVAVREGWRLTRRERDVPVGAPRPGSFEPGELPEPEAHEPTADEQALARIEHAERVADLRTLKPRERRELFLRGRRATATARSRRRPAPATRPSTAGCMRDAHACAHSSASATRSRATPTSDERGGEDRQPPPTRMTLKRICYRGRTVAAATRTRFFLAEVLDERPVSDPERTFVIFMCACAGDVLAGVLPGPYSDEDAPLRARVPGARGAARARRARRRADASSSAAAGMRAAGRTRRARAARSGAAGCLRAPVDSVAQSTTHP